MIETLPDSRTRVSRQSVFIDTPYGRMSHVPCFCANCGKPGPLVTEENVTFIFWLCEGENGCARKWSPLAGTMAVPDEVFFAKLREAQIEKYGRELRFPELVEAISDSTNILSKLAHDAPRRN